MTTRVIGDAANYQGVPNSWRAMGFDGMMLKAVEGMFGQTNPFLDAQIDVCKRDGIPYGFYDFWHPAYAGTADMQVLIQRIAGYQPRLGIAVDAEVNDNLGPATVLQRLIEDLQFVNARYPMRCWLYSAEWWMDPNLYGAQKYQIAQLAALWVAGYLSHVPPIPQPFQGAIMWQFTDSWRGGNQDASYFLGSDEQWNWLIGGTKPIPVPMTQKIRGVQTAVHATQDGVFGPDTHKRVMGIRAFKDSSTQHDAAAVKYAQQVMAFPAALTNGKYTKQTHDQIGVTIKKLQQAMGVTPVDGTWSANTEFAESVMDPMH